MLNTYLPQNIETLKDMTCIVIFCYKGHVGNLRKAVSGAKVPNQGPCRLGNLVCVLRL